jgi:hypothetical protein
MRVRQGETLRLFFLKNNFLYNRRGVLNNNSSRSRRLGVGWVGLGVLFFLFPPPFPSHASIAILLSVERILLGSLLLGILLGPLFRGLVEVSALAAELLSNLLLQRGVNIGLQQHIANNKQNFVDLQLRAPSVTKNLLADASVCGGPNTQKSQKTAMPLAHAREHML